MRNTGLVENKVWRPSFKLSQGFTPIELLIVIAIISILVATALPSFLDRIEREKLRSASELLRAELKWAKTEAVRTNQKIVADFTNGINGSWSFTFSPVVPVKVIAGSNYSDFSAISLKSSFVGSSTFFEPVRGKARAGSVVFSSTNFSLDVRVSVLGRVRICSTTGFTGIEPC